MEKFKAFLQNDIDFNIEIYNRIQDLKDKKLQKVDSSSVVFSCKLKIDIISLNDSDLELSTYIQANYPMLDDLIRDYVGNVLEREQSLKNFTIKSEQIIPNIEIANGNFTSNLGIYTQKNILQSSQKQGSAIQGQLVLLDYFQVLKIYPIENYFSLRRFSYQCGCFTEGRIFNKNLINHIMEFISYNNSISVQNNFTNNQKLPSCDQCHYEMIEDRNGSKIELCQKILIYIPEKKEIIPFTNGQQRNIVSKEGGKLYEMYIEKQYCNQLKLNQTYSCIAYFAINAIPRQSKCILLNGYKQLEISDKLFACTISSILKGQNANFNQQMINQVSLYCNISDNMSDQMQSQTKYNTNEDDTNFHFKFKQMMFGVDCFFDEMSITKFSFLHLKTALVLSYVLNNSRSLVSNMRNQFQFNHSEQLNVLFQCENSFIENIVQNTISSFGHLQNFNVFDCLLQSDIASALIKSNNGILLIKNMQDISKQHSEILQNVLQNQEIYIDSLKIKLDLKPAIWAFYTSIETSHSNRKFKSNKYPSCSIHIFEQLFDISLQHDKSIVSLKDYSISLQNEAEMFLRKQLSRNNPQMNRGKNAHELSTAKKSQLSKMNPFKEEVSTLKKNKESGNQEFINIQQIQQSEEQAYELLNGFINTVRNNSNDNDQTYSTSNIASLSKFAISSSIFRNVFIKQNRSEQYQSTDKSEENLRIVIDIFDAFVSVFFNILSRKIFSRELDTKYFISFILNYGVGYSENQDMVNNIIFNQRDGEITHSFLQGIQFNLTIINFFKSIGIILFNYFDLSLDVRKDLIDLYQE